MNVIIRFLLSGVAVLLAAYILPGVHVRDYLTALLVAFLVSVANTLVRPVLVVLTIPITLITLGLFLLVINAALIMAVDYLLEGFHVDGFWWALGFSILLSIVNSLFGDITRERPRE